MRDCSAYSWARDGSNFAALAGSDMAGFLLAGADDVSASMTRSVCARGRHNKTSNHSGMPTTRLASACRFVSGGGFPGSIRI
jgi:hypothetical protein